jgi:CheY-like chemotaxis protein
MAILVAAHPAGCRRMQHVLAGHDVTCVESSEVAKQALEHHDFSGIVLGLQFDESRMLELLEHLRSQPRQAEVPVLCVIGVRGSLSDGALRAFAQAARALGAREVLDSADFPDDERGNRALRRIVDQLMPATAA